MQVSFEIIKFKSPTFLNKNTICSFFSLAQKIQITENTKEALDGIGGYETVFRCKLEVKVRFVYAYMA